ncbi:MAG: hypothetical protein AAF135_12000 [Bacteroidota bacterium]
MMSMLLLLPLWLHFSAAPSPTLALDNVNKIIEGVPTDLAESKLLVARYDVYDMDDKPEGMPPQVLPRYNKLAKQSNSSIKKTIDAAYAHDYQMVGLPSVPEMKAEGYKYFMDMVLMPKQMSYPEKRAMVPAYEKYESTGKMFGNRYVQFHFYFYIRNLETNDVYITTRFKGNYDVYAAMKVHLKQVMKDLKAGNTGS